MSAVMVNMIQDGPRNAVVHIYVKGDVLGDVTDEVIIDPSTSFADPLPAEPALRLTKLWYDLSGFNSFLKFDYLTSDTPVWSMSGGQGTGPLDFCEFGGLTDRSNSLDGTGKLMLTTSGLEDGDFGSIILWVKKS